MAALGLDDKQTANCNPSQRWTVQGGRSSSLRVPRDVAHHAVSSMADRGGLVSGGFEHLQQERQGGLVAGLFGLGEA